MTTRQKGLLASLCLLLAACSSQPDAGSAGNWRGYTQTGLASYYADRYHNKRTASGEPYQRHANTAAHIALRRLGQGHQPRQRQERGGAGQRQGQFPPRAHHRSLQGCVQRHRQSPIWAYQGQD